MIKLLGQEGIPPSQINIDVQSFPKLAGMIHFNIYDSQTSKRGLEQFHQRQIKENIQFPLLKQGGFDTFQLVADRVSLEDNINLCQAAVAWVIQSYAKKDAARTVDAWQGYHLRRLIEYANGNYNFVQLAFAIANAVHETNYFSEFTEPISTLCRNYSGGCDYRGRGYTHLTNDFNYKTFGEIIKKDLIKTPDLAADNAVAFLIMNAYFEKSGVLGILSKSKDFASARKKINPGESLNNSVQGAKVGTTLEKKINILSDAMLRVLEGYVNGDHLIQYKIEF